MQTVAHQKRCSSLPLASLSAWQCGGDAVDERERREEAVEEVAAGGAEKKVPSVYLFCVIFLFRADCAVGMVL